MSVLNLNVQQSCEALTKNDFQGSTVSNGSDFVGSLMYLSMQSLNLQTNHHRSFYGNSGTPRFRVFFEHVRRSTFVRVCSCQLYKILYTFVRSEAYPKLQHQAGPLHRKGNAKCCPFSWDGVLEISLGCDPATCASVAVAALERSEPAWDMTIGNIQNVHK